MLKISDDLNKYISLVTLDFGEQTNDVDGLILAEYNRESNIKLAIVALVKLYKKLQLSQEEQEILNKYPLQNDYMTELESCIARIAYEISREARDKACKLRLSAIETERRCGVFNTCYISHNGYTMKVRLSEVYDEYLMYLGEYNEDLLHAWAYQHEIILIEPHTRTEVRPVMNFDDECFIEIEDSNRKKLRKKHKGLYRFFR